MAATKERLIQAHVEMLLRLPPKRWQGYMDTLAHQRPDLVGDVASLLQVRVASSKHTGVEPGGSLPDAPGEAPDSTTPAPVEYRCELTDAERASYMDRVNAFRLRSIRTPEQCQCAVEHAYSVASEEGRNHGDQAYLAALWDLIKHYKHRAENERRIDAAMGDRLTTPITGNQTH